MKRRIAILAAIAAASFSGGAAQSVAAWRADSPVVHMKTCSGYVRAVIGGEIKCLRRGQYCATRFKAQYPRYGFRCYGAPARLH